MLKRRKRLSSRALHKFSPQRKTAARARDKFRDKSKATFAPEEKTFFLARAAELKIEDFLF